MKQTSLILYALSECKVKGLNIYAISGPPVIYVPRTSYSVSSGSSVTLEVNVTSSLDITDLFWEKRNISSYIYGPIDVQSESRLNGGNITCPSLTVNGLNKNDNAYFRINVANRDGTTTGTNIRIDVILSTYLCSVNIYCCNVSISSYSSSLFQIISCKTRQYYGFGVYIPTLFNYFTNFVLFTISWTMCIVTEGLCFSKILILRIFVAQEYTCEIAIITSRHNEKF